MNRRLIVFYSNFAFHKEPVFYICTNEKKSLTRVICGWCTLKHNQLCGVKLSRGEFKQQFIKFYRARVRPECNIIIAQCTRCKLKILVLWWARLKWPQFMRWRMQWGWRGGSWGTLFVVGLSQWIIDQRWQGKWCWKKLCFAVNRLQWVLQWGHDFRLWFHWKMERWHCNIALNSLNTLNAHFLFIFSPLFCSRIVHYK